MTLHRPAPFGWLLCCPCLTRNTTCLNVLLHEHGDVQSHAVVLVYRSIALPRPAP